MVEARSSKRLQLAHSGAESRRSVVPMFVVPIPVCWYIGICQVLDTDQDGRISMTELYNGIFRHRDRSGVTREQGGGDEGRTEPAVQAGIAEEGGDAAAPAANGAADHEAELAALAALPEEEREAIAIKVIGALDKEMKRNYHSVHTPPVTRQPSAVGTRNAL